MQATSNAHTFDADRVFAALAVATRRDIVRRAMDGEQGVVELSANYPMSFAAAQKHIAVLESAGLVTKERIGRMTVLLDEQPEETHDSTTP